MINKHRKPNSLLIIPVQDTRRLLPQADWYRSLIPPFLERSHRCYVLSMGKIIGESFSGRLKRIFSRPQMTERWEMHYAPLIEIPFSILYLTTRVIMSSLYGFLMFYLRRLKIDFIYVSTLELVLTGLFLAKVLNSQLILNVGDPHWGAKSGLGKKLRDLQHRIAFAERRLKAVIVVDEALKHLFKKRYPDKIIEFVPFGYSESFRSESEPALLERLRERHNLKGKSVILYAGSVVRYPSYKFDLLVEAAPLVVESTPNARFVIVGDGNYLPNLRGLVSDRGLERYFVFIGWVPHDEVRNWINLADICLNPMRDVCLSVKIREYMACKKATIMTSMFHNLYTEVFKNDYNCLIIPPRAESVAAAITKLLKNPEFRQRIGEMGYNTTRGYDWHHMVKQIINLGYTEQRR